ncbi:MAG: hypothetical protein KKD18_01490 [Nanoarchaeota archaeon]|nr:hypothetical protein [Nanoarchaeota archaeon]MBU0977066.1 hypothetical protein [Nanoarchaeota archaeon]
MKSVIAQIFSGESSEEAHNEFVKFSRGVFGDRYVLEGKKQTSKWAVKTSSEFANFFVRRILENASGEIAVKGIIVSTSDLERDCEFGVEDVKKYMGIKQLVINCLTTPDKILGLMDKHPRAFYALSFSVGDYDLKIKAKPPKSGKPGTKTKGGGDEGPKADFCSLKTSDKKMIEDLFFDYPDFQEIKITHAIEVKEIELPKNYKTPEEMRENAVRKGVIKRIIDVDGRKEVKEKSFAV